MSVGWGVFSSTVGGRSPSMGGSVVGRVENIPVGGVGEDAEPSSEPVQASIAKAIKDTTPNINFRR